MVSEGADEPSATILQFSRAVSSIASNDPPLKGGGGDGISGGMEARVAKLEANMEHVRSDLAKLATVPADVATIKERSSHLATKADVKVEITAAIDRSATKTQRTVQIVGALVAIAVAVINYGPKILGN